MDAMTDPQPDVAPSDGRERELKLEAPQDALPALAARLKGLKGAAKRGVAARLVSTYFDTADRALAAHGASLRVRRRGRGFVQTIKRASTAVGLFDRPEWERRVRSGEPELSPDERVLLASILGRDPDALPAFAAIFSTNVKRTVFDVRRGDLAVEVALDEAALEVGEHRSAFCELELELLDGDPADLFALAREIVAEAPLRLSALSKSARGYAVVDGAHGKPVKAASSPIRAGMTVEEAFLAAVADCMVQFRRNEDVLLEGPHPKAVHQARVALRRLRSAFSLFKGVVVDARGEALRTELRWLAGALGDVRDLDVFAERRLALEDDAGDGEAEDEPGLSEIATRVGVIRQAAYDAAAEALRSHRARNLMIDLAEWGAIGAWRADPASAALRETPIEIFAEEVLVKRRRRLKKAGRELDRLDPVARHEVRIEAKKLRYAADFFEHVYPGAANRRRHAAFVGRLTALQGRLGDLNDIATARRITHQLARSAAAAGDGDAAFAAGAIAGAASADTRKLLVAAGKSFAALVKTTPFWR